MYTLVLLFRLIITCLSHDKVQESWLNAIKSSNTLCNEVVFILESSTNGKSVNIYTHTHLLH